MPPTPPHDDLAAALTGANGDRTAAAAALELSPATFYRYVTADAALLRAFPASLAYPMGIPLAA